MTTPACRSTAGLLALALASPIAARAELEVGPIKFDAGGTIMLGAGAYAADDTGPGEAAYRRGVATVQAYLLAKFSAAVQLDDGVTGGLFVRVRPYETPGLRTDVLPDAEEILKDAYARLKTAVLGEFRLGYQADVRVNQAIYAPQVCACADGFFGTNTAEITLAHGPVPENSTAADLDSRAPKLAWYSPVEGGLRLAFSYGPAESDGRQIDGRLGQDLTYATGGGAEVTDFRDGALRQFWSAAASWNTVEDEVSLSVEAGVSGAQPAGHLRIDGRNDADPLVWDAGVSLAYAAWKFGVSYEQQNHIDLSGIYGASAYQTVPAPAVLFLPPATNDIVTRTVDLGFTYSIGPVTAGIAWSRGRYEGLLSAADPRQAATNDVVFGGVQVEVSHGVDVLGGVQWNRYTPDGSGQALPATARLDAVYGGADPTLNIWNRGYSGVAVILGVVARF